MPVSAFSWRAALLAASTMLLSVPHQVSATRPRNVHGTHSSAAADPTLVGAGDIASCVSSGDEMTARLLDDIPGTVFTAGDNAYLSGKRMRNPFPCYSASWGRHRSRTRPVPGNHEYEGGYIDEYFDYFGSAAGDRGKGYYSYELGTWHILALNTVIETGPSSPQGKWLAQDLASNRRLCTLAYFHHPRFSSGPHALTARAVALWKALADAGVDVVVAGHDHIYERFRPMDRNGNPDDHNGVREFIVGTGGASHYAIRRIAPNSEVRNNATFGVIRFTLHPSTYNWKFVPVRGSRFSDSGSARCH